MVDLQSPKPLFRNVYRLVDKHNKFGNEHDVDIFDVLDAQQQGHFNVEPITSRKSIRDRYETMYKSVTRVPRTTRHQQLLSPFSNSKKSRDRLDLMNFVLDVEDVDRNLMTTEQY